MLPRSLNYAVAREGYEDGLTGGEPLHPFDSSYMQGWHAADAKRRHLDEELPEYQDCPQCGGEADAVADCDYCDGEGKVEV